MIRSGATLYHTSCLQKPYARSEILQGKIIKINPALVTILDGRIENTPPEILQRNIIELTAGLMECGKIHTFHIDINFPDYSGFGATSPMPNTAVFTPDFLAQFSNSARKYNIFLNIHLLTDKPLEHLAEYRGTQPGAICYQFDTIPDLNTHHLLIDRILELHACASPVIEIFGSENLIPKTKEELIDDLKPVLPKLGMLTFQVEKTAARANHSEKGLDNPTTREYMDYFKCYFHGTIQIQGGITTSTIAKAVDLGVEFMVCGTQIFRNPQNQAPVTVVEQMLDEAARVLC